MKHLAPVGVAVLSLGAASTALLVSATPASAGPGIRVFVGYADSFHAGGDFPNPWDGTPNVTFDGCSPMSACTFDTGAVRVENDNTSAVMINQVSVHIGACLYVWSGPLYPVKLEPGASLITTQRSSGAAEGCTGPDPATFDGSDIPNIGCTNDGIEPRVDVTVNGAMASSTDTGQVLNGGGIDPGVCLSTNESTQWITIGSKPCPGLSLILTPPAQTHSVGANARIIATFTNACGSPLSGVLVNFHLTAGPNAGFTGSGMTDVAGNAGFGYSSFKVGTDTPQAAVTNSVGFTTPSNTVNVTWIVEFAPGGGAFVIGNGDARVGNVVNFWGAQWAKRNSLTGGPAPRSFKGFAETPEVPQCGERWTADPGNSTPPPDGPLPRYMGVIVTSSADQDGSNIAGDTVEIVVIKTNPGYRPNPGHSGVGTVVSVVCGGPSGGPSGPVPTPSQGSGAPVTGPTNVAPPTPAIGCPTNKRAGCSLQPPGHVKK